MSAVVDNRGTQFAALLRRLTQLMTPSRLTFVFVTACFFPYPAINIGRSTGLQASQILALLAVPLLLVRRDSVRQLVAIASIEAGLAISFLVTAIVNPHSDITLMAKDVVAVLLAISVMGPAGWIAARGRVHAVLSAASVGVLFQSLVGAYQVVSFRAGRFPLLSLYHNASFASLEKVATIMALYERRPFGLMPEPSAMAASLGPWVILLAACGLISTRAVDISRPMRWLALLAAVSGTGLVLASRSGYVLTLIPVLGALIVLWAVKSIRRMKRSASIPLVTFAALVTALGGLALVAEMGPRFASVAASGDSWHIRFLSITTGLSFMTANAKTVIVGVGPGISPGLIQHSVAASAQAIDSVTVTYLVEAGVVGGCVAAVIFAFVIRSIVNSSQRATGVLCLLAWLASVIATTSYFPLSPIWILLGLLLSWDVLWPRSPSRVASMEHSDAAGQSEFQ